MKQSRNWFWGVFLLLAAVLIIASQMGSFVVVGFWSVLATIALVALMIKSLVRMNWTGILVPAALIYMIYQKPLDLMYISPWLLLLAAVLASAGLSMLFRPRPKVPPSYRVEEYSDANPPQTQILDNGDDNHPYAKVSFGANSRYLHSTSLESGQFYVSFGSMEVYLDGAQLAPQGATLFLDVSLGALTMYVPRYWQVAEKMSATMGNVNIGSTSPQTGVPQLLLTGNVMMGSVDVQYV